VRFFPKVTLGAVWLLALALPLRAQTEAPSPRLPCGMAVALTPVPRAAMRFTTGSMTLM
jgi:hypothetical protein